MATITELTRLDTLSAIRQLNENFRKLNTELSTKLSAAGGVLSGPLDANSQPIINLPVAFDVDLSAILAQLTAIDLRLNALETLPPVVVPPVVLPTLTITGLSSFAANTTAGTVIASIDNVPAGVTPTLTPNDGRLVIAGNASTGWKLAVGTSASSAGTISFTVAAAGALSAVVAVVVTAAVVTPPSTLQRLAPSTPISKGSPVAANTTLQNRMSGSTFTTNFPGLTIDNATGALTGTPTAYSGIVTETVNGTSRSTILFALPNKMRTMKLGMNMAPLNYYTRNDVYIDLMKSAGINTPPATVDARGMPQTLKADEYGVVRAIYLLPFYGDANTPFTYRVITDGDMDFEGFTKQGSDYVGTLYKGLGDFFVITAIRTPPTRLAVVLDSEAALFKAGQTLRPDFLEKMSGMAFIRTMDWNGTNETDPNTVPDNSLIYSRVPFEAQIRFSRELGVPLWLPLHAKTTDAQFQAMFPLLDQQVADGLAPRIEYSNEVWNDQFVQYAYAVNQATAAGYTGSNKAAWWMGRRIAQLAQLARGRGYKFMTGVQPVQQSQSPAFFAGTASVSGYLDSDIYGWISTGYNAGTLPLYGPDPDGLDKGQGPLQDSWVNAGDYDSGMDNILNSTVFGSLSGKVNAQFLTDAKTIANAHGWVLEEYESNWGHLNILPFARLKYAPYGTYLFNMMGVPLAKEASTQNMLVSEEVGVAAKCWFNYNDNVGNTDNGRFGVRRVPAMQAITDWLGNGGAVPRVVISNQPQMTPTTAPVFDSTRRSAATSLSNTNHTVTGINSASASSFTGTVADYAPGSGVYWIEADRGTKGEPRFALCAASTVADFVANENPEQTGRFLILYFNDTAADGGYVVGKGISQAVAFNVASEVNLPANRKGFRLDLNAKTITGYMGDKKSAPITINPELLTARVCVAAQVGNGDVATLVAPTNKPVGLLAF